MLLGAARKSNPAKLFLYKGVEIPTMRLCSEDCAQSIQFWQAWGESLPSSRDGSLMAVGSYCQLAVAGCERIDGFPGEKSVNPLCHSLGMKYSLLALEDFFFSLWHITVVLHVWISYKHLLSSKSHCHLLTPLSSLYSFSKAG